MIQVRILLALFMLGNVSQSHAIFYLVKKHVHAVTGQELWTFSDVHLDVDYWGQATELQRKALVAAAQQKGAHLIVEDPDIAEIPDILKTISKIDKALACVSSTLFVYQKYMQRNLSGLAWQSFTVGLSFYPELLGAYTTVFLKVRDYQVRLADTKRAFMQDRETVQFLEGASPLIGCVKECKKNNVSCTSIEFRFGGQWLATYYKLLKKQDIWSDFQSAFVKFNHIVLDTFSCDKTKQYFPYSLADVLNQNKVITEEIRSYPQQNDILKTFYQQCIDNYAKDSGTEYLKNIMNCNPGCTFPELVAGFDHAVPAHEEKSSEAVKTAYNTCLIHNASLLDARIINSLSNCTDKKVVFIAAGGWHVENISPILARLGYTQVDSLGYDGYQAFLEYDTKGTALAAFGEHIADLEAVFESEVAKAQTVG